MGVFTVLHIKSLDNGLELFKALGSDMRVQILDLLLEEKQMSMNQIAARLNITNGALTGHIRKLESCGLISISNDSASHGNQKLCSLTTDRILIDIEQERPPQNVQVTQMRVGHFSAHCILPTCGIATSKALIGETDDPRYFDHPDRYNADILWFARGFVEYTVPNFIPRSQRITGIGISCEMSSEAPGVNSYWPSDITFSINGVELGVWTSPGDFGESKGLLTPDWWPVNWNQYGILKLLMVTPQGTFIDGLRISDVTVDDLGLSPGQPALFRMAVLEDARNVGGLTLFGKSFGNYRQDISFSFYYEPIE